MRMLTSLDVDPSGAAHNVILSNRYLIVIPRRKASTDQPPYQMPNAAGMAGLIWCPSEEIAQAWVQVGPVEALARFGFAKDMDGTQFVQGD